FFNAALDSSFFPSPPPLPASSELFSPSETTDLFGFLENFNFELDFDLGPAGPAYNASITTAANRPLFEGTATSLLASQHLRSSPNRAVRAPTVAYRPITTSQFICLSVKYTPQGLALDPSEET
ncbi:hypothetical protein EVJ58_g10939, partial [Rhodofomes roseus]